MVAILWKAFWSKILSNELLGGDIYLDAPSDIKPSLKAKIFVKNLQLQVAILKYFFLRYLGDSWKHGVNRMVYARYLFWEIYYIVDLIKLSWTLFDRLGNS